MIGTGAYASDGESTDAVGSTDGEEVVVGCRCGVAVAIYNAGKDACGKTRACGKGKLAGVLYRCLYKLCKGDTEEFFSLFFFSFFHVKVYSMLGMNWSRMEMYRAGLAWMMESNLAVLCSIRS